jgi:hypothetical protein
MWKSIAILALAGLLAIPAWAEEGEKPAKPEKRAPGTSVEMPAIISPMDDEEGKLAGYAYITCTIIASSPDVAVSIRSKTPFIQDAFVRDVNHKSVALASDLSQVDKAGVVARFLADARKIMGEKKVVSLSITQVQMSTLRAGPPSEVPLDRLPETASAPHQPDSAPEPEKTAS